MAIYYVYLQIYIFFLISGRKLQITPENSLQIDLKVMSK